MLLDVHYGVVSGLKPGPFKTEFRFFAGKHWKSLPFQVAFVNPLSFVAFLVVFSLRLSLIFLQRDGFSFPEIR